MERSTRPAEIARHTVDRNGGEYTTSVVELLSLFGYSELTDHEREEIREALRAEQVGTDPGLFALETGDQVRLCLVQPDAAFAAPVPGGFVEPSSSPRTPMQRLRPRTWKGWTGYGIAALFILAVLTSGSEDSQDPRPAAESVEEQTAVPEATSEALEREEARAERARVRRERARLRRERAEVRREREQAREDRAEARRLRQERLEEQAAPPPEPEETASCHPSYDPCLDPTASDYDCEDGSGDGPGYTGFVTVTGVDDFDLDSDGDGTGCES